MHLTAMARRPAGLFLFVMAIASAFYVRRDRFDRVATGDTIQQPAL